MTGMLINTSIVEVNALDEFDRRVYRVQAELGGPLLITVDAAKDLVKRLILAMVDEGRIAAPAEDDTTLVAALMDAAREVEFQGHGDIAERLRGLAQARVSTLVRHELDIALTESVFGGRDA